MASSKPFDDTCPVCNGHLGEGPKKFMHWIRHIQEGRAIGSFDKNGTWFFRLSETEIKVKLIRKTKGSTAKDGGMPAADATKG